MGGIHDYKTPKGEFHEVKNEGGSVSFEIKWNPDFGPKLSKQLNSAQEYIDTKCLQYCQPLVPKRENILIESGILNTKIGSGFVKYNTPYARRWYYMSANFNQAPMRGNYWFERMKEQYRDQILKGAARFMK